MSLKWFIGIENNIHFFYGNGLCSFVFCDKQKYLYKEILVMKPSRPKPLFPIKLITISLSINLWYLWITEE